jgi:uncharacterized protein YukE
MTGIDEAAKAEHVAELSRNRALSAWRAAWWQTTMVLAEAMDGPEARETVRRAKVILGHSGRYLSQRRALGLALGQYSLAEVSGLPPRLALFYITTVKADPGRIREVLADAQERELSLRDLARELGKQPDSWKRQGEREQARMAAHKTEAAAVIAALDALAKAVTALAAATEPADPEELAVVADRAEAVRPSVDWLVTLRKRVSAA